MRPPQEEIHIAVIVLRRPAKEGRLAWNPGDWAQSMLANALAQGTSLDQSESAALGRLPKGPEGRRAGVRMDGRTAPGRASAQRFFFRLVFWGLGLVCLAGSAYSFYLARH